MSADEHEMDAEDPAAAAEEEERGQTALLGPVSTHGGRAVLTCGRVGTRASKYVVQIGTPMAVYVHLVCGRGCEPRAFTNEGRGENQSCGRGSKGVGRPSIGSHARRQCSRGLGIATRPHK